MLNHQNGYLGLTSKYVAKVLVIFKNLYNSYNPGGFHYVVFLCGFMGYNYRVIIIIIKIPT